MKLLIVLNGECKDYDFLYSLSKQYDSVCCADGGYNHATKAGIVPDLVIGDFDSSEIPLDVEVLKYPVEKDDTDAEIAIKEGLTKKFSSITLTCALGGRTDHLLTNILMLSRFNNVKIEENDCSIEIIDNFKKLENRKGNTVSLIPLEKTHICLDGFKYPLNGVVEFGTTLTMSNIVVSDDAEIKIKYGKVIMVITK